MAEMEGDRGQTSITDFYAATFRKAAAAGGDKGGKQQQRKPRVEGKKEDRGFDVGAPPGSADALAQTRTLLLQRLEQALSYTEARGSAIVGLCQPQKPSIRKIGGEVVNKGGGLATNLEQLPPLLAPHSADELDVRAACMAVASASRAFAAASLVPVACYSKQQKPGSPGPAAPSAAGWTSSSAATPSSVSPTKGTPQQRPAPVPQQQPQPAPASGRADAGRGGAERRGGKRTASAAASSSSEVKPETAVWEEADPRAPASKRRARRPQTPSDTGFGVLPKRPAQAPAQPAAPAPVPVGHCAAGGGPGGGGGVGGGSRRHVLVERQLRLKQQAQQQLQHHGGAAPAEVGSGAPHPSAGMLPGAAGAGGRAGGSVQFRRAGDGGSRGGVTGPSVLSFSDGSTMMMQVTTPFGAVSKPSPPVALARAGAQAALPQGQQRAGRAVAPASPLTMLPESPRTLSTPSGPSRAAYHGDPGGDENARPRGGSQSTPVFPDDMARAMVAKPTSDSGGGGEVGASLYCFEQLASQQGSPLLEGLFGGSARAAPLSPPSKPMVFASPQRLDSCRAANMHASPSKEGLGSMGMVAAMCALASPIRDANVHLVSPIREAAVRLVSPIRDANVMSLFSAVPYSPLPPLQAMHPEGSFQLPVEGGD